MSTTTTSFNNDTDMTKFKRTLLSKLMYLSLDGCLSPLPFYELVGYFKHYNRVLLLLSCLITLMMSFHPYQRSYGR